MKYRADRSDAPAPIGAIRTRQEIVDLVIEARKEKKAIRVWTVSQSGYLGCFYITSRSRLHKPTERLPGDTFFKLDVVRDHSSLGYRTANKRWFKGDEIMGSWNIQCYAGNCHYAFTSKIAAERYSDELKNDARYIQSVLDHHARCDALFGRW